MVTEKRGPGRPPKPRENNIIIFSELSKLGKIKYLISTAKQKIINYLSRHHIKLLNIIWIIIIIFVFPTGIFLGRKTYVIDDYTNPKYSYMEKVRHLHKTWRQYRSLKPDELHILWLQYLKSYTYRRGGDPIMGNLDCLRSVILFLRSRGANFEVATIDILASRFRAMNELGYTALNGPVHSGDLILFKPIYYEGQGNIPHIGIALEEINGVIKYMDFSPLGVGYPTVRRGDWRIHMIAEMSFPIWAGQALKK